MLVAQLVPGELIGIQALGGHESSHGVERLLHGPLRACELLGAGGTATASRGEPAQVRHHGVAIVSHHPRRHDGQIDWQHAHNELPVPGK